ARRRPGRPGRTGADPVTADYPPVAGLDDDPAGGPGAGAPGDAGRPGSGGGPGGAGEPGRTGAGEPGRADPRAALEAGRAGVAKAVVGQDSVVTGLVICLLCRGHALLEGVPGVAKTLLVRALAGTLSLRSARVQFTADLMPGDLTGSLIYDAKTALFQFRAG